MSIIILFCVGLIDAEGVTRTYDFKVRPEIAEVVDAYDLCHQLMPETERGIEHATYLIR